MTKKFSTILAKTLALLAVCTLAFTLMACANQSREKYAGVYHCDSSSRTTISFFGKTQINGWGIQDINLNEDGTVRANGEIQEGVTWSVKDSEIIFTNGEQEEVMQISDDDTELISGDLTFKKSR